MRGSPDRINRFIATVSTTAALMLAATAAQAQTAEPTGRSLDRWQPGLDVEAIGSVNVATMPLVTSWDAWFKLGFAYNLLLVRDGDTTGALVGPRLFSHLGGSYTVLPWLQVGANLPLVLYQDRGADPPPAFGPVGSLSAGGLGDLSVTAKAAVFSADETWVDLAFLLSLGLPTHVPRDAYLGDPFSFSGTVAASRSIWGFDLAANFGYHWRPSVRFLGTKIGPEFRLGFGAGYDLESLTTLPLTAEATWTLATRHDAPFSNIDETPSELLFGATYREWSPIVVSAAAGFGLVAGIGTPDVRVVLGVRWVERPKDRDKDGNPDGADACPDEPEDVDGFEDSDGCPDPDNDEDGIIDEMDECPDEPESFNDVEDEDGCPDSAVSISVGRLDLGENVHFEVNKAVLKKKSKLLLNEVAEVLEAHPQILKLRIEGHTDSDGEKDTNLKLSQNRARSVRDYLISQGIDGGRLTSEGFGESQPIASNETKRGRAANRRVEFLIEELVGDSGVEVATEEPGLEETPTEEPELEEPELEEPPTEKPETDEPKADEPTADEPKADEPKADEPKADEPKTDEPKTDEPKTDEPADK